MGARPSDVKERQSRAQNSNEMPLLRCVYYERDFYTRTAAKSSKTNHNPALAVSKTLAAAHFSVDLGIYISKTQYTLEETSPNREPRP